MSEEERRERGTGREPWQRKFRDPKTREWKKASTWTIQWYDRRLGATVRETARGEDSKPVATKRQAETVLRKRLSDQDAGTPSRSSIERTTLEQLVDLVETDYRSNGRKSLSRALRSITRLRAELDGPAIEITAERLARYVRTRLGEGEANATINRDLAILKRAFRLGERAGLAPRRPYIAMLAEHNARKGFFEPKIYKAVLAHLPHPEHEAIEVAYETGWRLKSEILSRQWKHVDLVGGWLRLEPGETKNGDGRNFPLTPELLALFKRLRRETDAHERRSGSIVPWVFHRDGKQMRDLRATWLRACAAAGAPGRYLHDFRRTAVRNLERAAVPRSTAMAMVGHKTESIYRRYAITDDAMLREGAERLATYLGAQKRKAPAK